MRTSVLPDYPWLDQTELVHSNVADEGWRTLIEDLLREIDKVLAHSAGWLAFREINEKHGALDSKCAMHRCSEAEKEAIGEVYRASQWLSQSTCLMCGAPGRLAAPYGWLIPLCREHGGDNPSGPLGRSDD